MPLRDTHNRILRWCVLLADIAERKRAEALLDGEKRLLEMVAAGWPLEKVLEAICDIHEKRIGAADANWPDWYAAYMAAEQSGTELPK